MDGNIDFVIIWVDGDDEEWQKSRNCCLGIKDEVVTSMYRNWDNLQYWFRGVEKFTPWVNKIHFVTCGHLPKWLNINHPKLHIVKHSDYMPEEYLPTFNSHAIELNLHRIEGLAEQFVYFNDDTFIMDQMQATDFFKNGLPCDTPILSSLVPLVPKDPFFHYFINNLSIINYHFSKRKVLKKNWSKWFSLKYGKLLFKNIYYAPVGGFSGFLNFHLPAAFLKASLKEVWEKEPEVLAATSINKFRTIHDVNQYIFSYWQFATGNFTPRKTNYGRFFLIEQDNQDLFECMSLRKYKMFCINDNPAVIHFDEKKEALKKQFSQLLPEQSKFEL
ncbi:MAG: Stealth CR1 domain-containing protein [Desulfotomaculaceae bacterium]|nr:Stealth CR1 domain-containing protein [Desulfotomaculaceae bacterium]